MENHFFLLIFAVQTDAALLFSHCPSFRKLSMSTLCEAWCLWLTQREMGRHMAEETWLVQRGWKGIVHGVFKESHHSLQIQSWGGGWGFQQKTGGACLERLRKKIPRKALYTVTEEVVYRFFNHRDDFEGKKWTGSVCMCLPVDLRKLGVGYSKALPTYVPPLAWFIVFFSSSLRKKHTTEQTSSNQLMAHSLCTKWRCPAWKSIYIDLKHTLTFHSE